MRILLVEDEAKVAKALEERLVAEQYEVKAVRTGEEAFFLMTTQPFDLMLLDLRLPGRDGLEILEALRGRGVDTPVLILTARDSIEDRVQGLNTGADDYLVKPFAFPEVLARIRALTRRGRGEPVTRLRLADLEIDCAARRASRAGRDLDLTQKEFEILEFLLRNQRHVVSREMLARGVWGVAARAASLHNVIDVHIARLRRKIDDPFETKLLRTVRGLGFLLSEEVV